MLIIIGLAMFIFIIVFSLKRVKEKKGFQQEEHKKIVGKKRDREVLLHTTFSYPKQLTKHLKVISEIQYQQHQYTLAKKWNQGFLNVLLTWESTLNPFLSYSKKLYRINESPFLFEKEFTRTSDEVGGGIEYQWKRYKVATKYDHDIVLNQARAWTVTGHYQVHCWTWLFNWNIQQKSFKLGASIH